MNSNRDSIGTDSDNPPEASINEDEDIANEAPSDSDVPDRAIKKEPHTVTSMAYDEDTVCSETGPQEFKSAAIPVEVKEEKALKDTGEDDDDVGALIYRESQLRKAEAAAVAAAAAQRKKISSDSTHHRTSTRKRPSITSRRKESLSRPQRNSTSKRRLEEYSLGEERPRQNVTKKKRKYECSLMDARTKLSM